MTARTDRSDGARRPFGLLGMIVLIALVEGAIASHSTRFMLISQLDWQSTGRAAYRKAAGCEVLCFGDSMLKFGLSPRILQRDLGRRTYSFALLDGKPPASYFLFRRAIESGARPAAVTVDFQPECMAQDIRHLLENPNWSSLVNLREIADLSWNYRNPTYFARALCETLLPSIRCRAQIRSNAVIALNGACPPYFEENEKVKRNWKLNQGGLLLAKNQAFNGEVTPEVARSGFIDRWWSKPENSNYIRRFLALAEQHQIRVYWIIAPNAPKVLAAQDKMGLSARYTRYLQSAMQKYRCLRVIDTRSAEYGADVFVDPVHLDRDGNLSMTHGVASILRHDLTARTDGPRWNDLPKYRPSHSEIALEDVNQSLAAIRQGQAGRRR